MEGHNATAVDLFHTDHARKVLVAFGRAYGKLPESPAEPDAEQERFLGQAINALAEEVKVICVRLAVFAEMMKSRPWTTASLKEVGGAEGVGVAFLQETFSAKTSPMAHRQHEKAVRSVLKAMLPEQGTDIKAEMKSYQELLEASGFQQRPADFDALLRILDNDVRLITPTEPDQTSVDEQPGPRHEYRYYQLTHDFLVPSMRDWLTRKQRESRRGRAELRLAERSALWNAKPENRHLPAWWEYANIRLLTDKKNWSKPQRKMMAWAGRVHGFRWGTALLVTVIIAVTVQHMVATAGRQNLTQQIATTVSSLNTSRGIVLPPLKTLDQFPSELLLDELRRQFDTATDRKLPLAYALSHYGDVRIDFLLSQVEEALPHEAANFVDALGHAEQEASEAIQAAAGSLDGTSTPTLRHKARLAMLSLHLGDPSLATVMCQLRADPIQRTVFIDECSSWCGDLLRLSRLGPEIDNAVLRSALCLAVGGVVPDDVTAEQQESWQALLADWHQNQPDSGTHSASGWALKQRELASPKISTTARPVSNRDWWHTQKIGLTMVRIPAGKVRGDSGPIEVSQEFWLSDREISVGQFQQFLEDPDFPADEKPNDWGGVLEPASPTSDHPVQQVSWYDAVMYCNWLSIREGLAPCYKRTGEKYKDHNGKEAEYDDWQLDVSPNGYRLPTDAEWEYACRAGTTSTYSFGDEAAWLDAYGVYRADLAEACGEKLPNGWGLFDVHGNVYEWCNDAMGSYRGRRGGSWYGTAWFCRSSYRVRFDPSSRFSPLGFRLAAVPSRHGPEAQQPGSGADSAGRLGGSSGASPSDQADRWSDSVQMSQQQ